MPALTRIAALITAVSVLAIAVVRGTPLRATIAMKPGNQSDYSSMLEPDLAGQPHARAAESIKRPNDAAD